MLRTDCGVRRENLEGVEKVLEGRREDFMRIIEDKNEDNVAIARFPDLPFLSALTTTPSQAS